MASSCRQQAIMAAKKARTWQEFRQMTAGSNCNPTTLGQIWKTHKTVGRKTAPRSRPASRRLTGKRTSRRRSRAGSASPLRGRKSSGKRMCQPQSSKKYMDRPSPPYPANECCGIIMRGNDRRLYVSKPNVNGVCSWRKA